jgi:glycerate kinase
VRVVVAMDSFKGSCSAAEACEAVVKGLLEADPGLKIVTRPMADGGEGTAATLLAARGGTWIEEEVSGPLPDRTVAAAYAWLPTRGPAAVVEMASASGIELLAAHELNPLRTSTYGTGELLASALARGPERAWLCIGGSATVDGGVGAAQALGWRFLDAAGREIQGCGGELTAIRRIERPTVDPAADPTVEVLCDVDNPLLGPRGAAAVFGPQKGATPEMIVRLENGLANLADVIERDLGLDVRGVPGAGAAGGLGGGALAFLGATLVSGVDAVIDASGLADDLSDADWVVTGEGRFDEQSFQGKVVSGVARTARSVRCRVAVLAGSVAVDPQEALHRGVEHVRAVTPAHMTVDEAVPKTPALLTSAAKRMARELFDA